MFDVVFENIDPYLERTLRFASKHTLKDPIRWGLVSHRKRVAEHIIEKYRLRMDQERLNEITHAQAREQFDTLMQEAMTEMRAEKPSSNGQWSLERLLFDVEQPLYRNQPEYLDDPNFPMQQRMMALKKLHFLNTHIGSYDVFCSIIEPLIARAASQKSGPVRIHDLASGHGGFAVYLKEKYRERIDVTASDLKTEYLELGKHWAMEAKLDVNFVYQDAFNLINLKEQRTDIFLCTQAIHHFSPGMVSRLFAECARACHSSVCFIDAERSWLAYALIGLTAFLYGRNSVFFHDATTSIRRMYYEEELEVLAKLAPNLPKGKISTGARGPDHAYVSFENI